MKSDSSLNTTPLVPLGDEHRLLLAQRRQSLDLYRKQRGYTDALEEARASLRIARQNLEEAKEAVRKARPGQ